MMSSAPKFVFECLESECPDHRCCNRSPVMIYFEDLRRWTTDQTLNVVFPNLEFTSAGGYPILVLKKYPNETLCAMFNKETKNCNIYYSKPISCSSYPLGYNGNSYYVIDKKCEGLGKGTMTKESLKEIRSRAQLEFHCRTRTNSALPMLQMLILQFMQKQSMEAMKDLSEEDKKKLEEILQKKEKSPSSEKKEPTPSEKEESPSTDESKSDEPKAEE